MLAELRSFEIQQVDYSDRFRLFNSLKETKVSYNKVLVKADAFVKMFADSNKNPPKPIKKVGYSIVSKDELKELVSANVRKS